MAAVLKLIIGLFVLGGICLAVYSAREMLYTANDVKNAIERTRGTFVGYTREEVTSISAAANQWGAASFQESTSYMSYPVYKFTTETGETITARDPKLHIIERFTPGQQVDVLVSRYGNHRLADPYSLYSRDVCVLVAGLSFIFIPLIIGHAVIPSLSTPAGTRMEQFFRGQYEMIASSKVGPFDVRSIMKGTIIFVALVVSITISGAVMPFARQLHLGFGWGLMNALKESRYDEARELILSKKGINKINEYEQTPLLLALEAGRTDLARMLIEAGADVNVKSKMMMTPLRVATQSGDLEMVKILLAKGASPDAPEDEYPPVFYAFIDGRDDIARVLIESKCDLSRKYISGHHRITVGDVALHAGKRDLADLVRRKGGTFTAGFQGL